MVKVWISIGAGIAFLGVILGIVMLNVSWAATDSFGADSGYKAMSSYVDAPGTMVLVPYTADQFDDTDGAGLMRTAGPLLLAGTVLVALAALALEHRLFLGWDWLTMAGAGAASLGALLLLVGLILLPIGISMNADDATIASGQDLTWSGGLYLGILTTLFSLGAAAVSWIASVRAGAIQFPEAVRTADFD